MSKKSKKKYQPRRTLRTYDEVYFASRVVIEDSPGKFRVTKNGFGGTGAILTERDPQLASYDLLGLPTTKAVHDTTGVTGTTGATGPTGDAGNGSQSVGSQSVGWQSDSMASTSLMVDSLAFLRPPVYVIKVGKGYVRVPLPVGRSFAVKDRRLATRFDSMTWAQTIASTLKDAKVKRLWAKGEKERGVPTTTVWKYDTSVKSDFAVAAKPKEGEK